VFITATPLHSRIMIPSIGISAPIVRGVSDSKLAHGAGHYPGTAWPGHPGTVGLAGHDVTYVPNAKGGHVFGRLAEIRETDGSVIGKKVIIDFQGKHYEYKITKQEVVPPTDVAVLKGPKYGRRLVLTTCYPRFSAAKRLVTIAWQTRKRH
jgi:sortase A